MKMVVMTPPGPNLTQPSGIVGSLAEGLFDDRVDKHPFDFRLSRHKLQQLNMLIFKAPGVDCSLVVVEHG